MSTPGQPDPYDLDPDRATLLRSTVLAWQASTVMLLIGALLTLAWGWELVRVQQHVAGAGFVAIGGGFGGSASTVQRIDAAMGTMSLLAYAAVTTALGFGLRMAADVVATRVRAQQVAAPEPTIGPDTP